MAGWSASHRGRSGHVLDTVQSAGTIDSQSRGSNPRQREPLVVERMRTCAFFGVTKDCTGAHSFRGGFSGECPGTQYGPAGQWLASLVGCLCCVRVCVPPRWQSLGTHPSPMSQARPVPLRQEPGAGAAERQAWRAIGVAGVRRTLTQGGRTEEAGRENRRPQAPPGTVHARLRTHDPNAL